jgi:hypothetical protein
MSYAGEWHPGPYAEHERFIEAELDAYAHEVAETIRLAARQTSGQMALGMFAAADLIDPEVQE